MEIKPILSNAGKFLQKNSPHILTGLGVAGLVSTAVASGKAAVCAHDVLGRYDNPDLKDKVKLTWRYFIPPVIIGGTSIACIIGANSVNHRRNLALATLYSISENTLNELKDKMAENLRPKDLNRIQEEMAEKKIIENPSKDGQIIITGKGDMLCYDVLSGRYFKNDIETLRRAMNDINKDVIDRMWVPLNDFYFLIGLEPIKIGEDIGWNTDHMADFVFTSKLTDDGQPCIVLDHSEGLHTNF